MAHVDVTDATFEREVLEASREQPVVVDFWADWCQPCRMIGPVLERLAAAPDTGFKLAKVDVDANPNVSSAFRIQSIPAVKAFSNGQVVDEFVGAIPEQAITQWLQGILPDASADELEEARRAASRGRYEEAREKLAALNGNFDADRLRLSIDRVEREVPEVAEGVPEVGLERLLQALRSDPEAREAMLAAFDVLGEDEPASREYRRRLANELF